MRLSKFLARTLRGDPSEAEVPSHRLMLRAGMVHQVASGVYSYAPLAQRSLAKIQAIIRREMDAADGQEVRLAALQPLELWRQSGRDEAFGPDLIRLNDRRDRPMVMAPTHEEVVTLLVRQMVQSYRDLPLLLYQIQTKFRDEPRPKSGLLRVREFAMKDSYSIDIDDAGLDRSFDLHHLAYTRIFARLGLDALPVEASSGAMGGSASVEFMVESPAGEDDVARCTDCGYAANVERASAATTPVENRPGGDAPERFPTPGIRTITALAEAGHPPEHQVKTLVYEADGDLVLILLRGDHPFLEQKFTDATGAGDLRPAEPDRILDALGASPGSLGAVGVDGPTVYADHALRGRSGMTTGANDDDFHLEGVDVERDITVDHWLDLRGILDGEPCVNCGKSLQVVRCIEAGHIFKLGRRYAEAMDMSVLDADGNSRIPTMGSYGIGVGRAMAAVAEVHHDDSGLIWPVAIAPYEVVLTVVKTDHEPSMELAERWTDELTAAGIDVLLDDRDARPGVKFADAELLGIPLRVTIGPRGLDQGSVEFTRRSTGDNEDVAIDDLVQVVLDAVVTGRRLGA